METDLVFAITLKVVPSFLFVFVLIIFIFKLLKPSNHNKIQLIAFCFALGMIIHELIKNIPSNGLAMFSIVGIITGYTLAAIVVRNMSKRQ